MLIDSSEYRCISTLADKRVEHISPGQRSADQWQRTCSAKQVAIAIVISTVDQIGAASHASSSSFVGHEAACDSSERAHSWQVSASCVLSSLSSTIALLCQASGSSGANDVACSKAARASSKRPSAKRESPLLYQAEINPSS